MDMDMDMDMDDTGIGGDSAPPPESLQGSSFIGPFDDQLLQDMLGESIGGVWTANPVVSEPFVVASDSVLYPAWLYPNLDQLDGTSIDPASAFLAFDGMAATPFVAADALQSEVWVHPNGFLPQLPSFQLSSDPPLTVPFSPVDVEGFWPGIINHPLPFVAFPIDFSGVINEATLSTRGMGNEAMSYPQGVVLDQPIAAGQQSNGSLTAGPSNAEAANAARMRTPQTLGNKSDRNLFPFQVATKISPSAWKDVVPTVRELYVVMNVNLRLVQTIMACIHRHRATSSMYKSHRPVKDGKRKNPQLASKINTKKNPRLASKINHVAFPRELDQMLNYMFKARDEDNNGMDRVHQRQREAQRRQMAKRATQSGQRAQARESDDPTESPPPFSPVPTDAHMEQSDVRGEQTASVVELSDEVQNQDVDLSLASSVGPRGKQPVSTEKLKSNRRLKRERAHLRHIIEFSLPQSLKRYREQEIVLYCVNRALLDLFYTKSAGGPWSVATVGFQAPPGIADMAALWDTLTNQSYSANTLCKSGAFDKAEVSLQCFYDGLRVAARRTKNPMFLVTLWRICLNLRSINSHAAHLNPFGRFFNILKEVLPAVPEEDNPLVTLVDALSRVQPHDFKSTLRIGYYMAIRTVEDAFGNGIPIVLHMRTQYWQYWDKQYAVKDELIERLREGLGEELRAAGGGGDATLTILYYIVLAKQYIQPERKDYNKNAFQSPATRVYVDGQLASGADSRLNPPESIDQELLDLHARAVDVLERESAITTTYTPALRAFSFACKQRAAFHHARWEAAECQENMEAAIDRLLVAAAAGGVAGEQDRDCRIRAALMCTQLAKYLDELRKPEEAEQARRRRAEIEREIEGLYVFKPCTRCPPGIIDKKCHTERKKFFKRMREERKTKEGRPSTEQRGLSQERGSIGSDSS